MKSSSPTNQSQLRARTSQRIVILCTIVYAALMRAQKDVAFRIEVTIVALLVPTAFYISTSAIELSLLIFVVIFTALTEMLRAAIDLICAHVSHNSDATLEAAQLLSSFAVLMAAACAIFVWLVIGVSNFGKFFG